MEAASPRMAAADAYCAASTDFPVPAGPMKSALVPRSRPPPRSASSSASPLGTISERKGWWCSAAIRRANTRMPPRSMRKSWSPPLGAVERRELLQRNDSMGQALELEIARLAGAIVGHQYGGPARGEMLLERQELAPVAQRALGQEPHLRQRVEHHPNRFDALDLGQQRAGHFGQLDLG